MSVARTTADFNCSGNVPYCNEALTILVTIGSSSARQFLNNHVGIGSVEHDLVPISLITETISSGVRNLKLIADVTRGVDRTGSADTDDGSLDLISS